MTLTPEQADAIGEILNMAFGRAARSLSELTGRRVLLEPPEVEILPVAKLKEALTALFPERVGSVQQVFHGPVNGTAVLLFSEEAALTLVKLLADDPEARAGTLGETAREVLGEVGNILLNACLGRLGNLLRVPVSFSVPETSVETVGHLVEGLRVHQHPVELALVIATRFRLRQETVTARLVFVLGVDSIAELVKAIELMEHDLQEQLARERERTE